MHTTKRLVISSAVSTIVVLAMVGGVLKAGAVKDDKNEVKLALPAEQVIASIRTAIAAKPGRVLEVEGESEQGKSLCEVEILADDGKIYEVVVNAVSNKIEEIELEEDQDGDVND